MDVVAEHVYNLKRFQTKTSDESKVADENSKKAKVSESGLREELTREASSYGYGFSEARGDVVVDLIKNSCGFD